jgi:hypothetical protein
MGRKPASRVDAVLDELGNYGFTLTLDAQRALSADPPKTEQAFVNAVFVAEGFGPVSAEVFEHPDRDGLVAYVKELVHDWLFDEGQGKGTRSGLPYTFMESD